MAAGVMPGRQKFGQPPRRGDLLKIEVRQAADLADRNDQSPAMPTANHGHAHPQQIGQHGGRVEPVDVVLVLDQAQPLPELRFGYDLDFAFLGRLPHRFVEPFVRPFARRPAAILLRPPRADRPRRRAR